MAYVQTTLAIAVLVIYASSSMLHPRDRGKQEGQNVRSVVVQGHLHTGALEQKIEQLVTDAFTRVAKKFTAINESTWLRLGHISHLRKAKPLMTPLF
jgi:hypothetical protein